MRLTYDKIKEMYNQHGYRFYDSGIYNVNIFGIRAENPLVDEFGCLIGIAFTDDFGNNQCLMWESTTLPGLYWLKNKLGNLNGTFILQPNQYERVWAIGEHKGYEALVQIKNGIFKGWRDNDSDGAFDFSGKIYSDATGVNCHTTSFINEVDNVGPYSAGCQVNKRDEDHRVKMEICKRSRDLYGNLFTYTLF